MSEFRSFAEQQFKLSAKGGSGASVEVNENQVRNSAFASATVKEKAREEAEQRIPCPDELEWLWGVFSELNATRNYTEAGPTAINHHDLICWQYVNQTCLTIWESDLLFDVDLRYRLFASKERDKQLKKGRKK
jgi:hypothetical protein